MTKPAYQLVPVMGYSNSGKSTIAKLLKRHSDTFVTLDSIAPLRRKYETIYNLPTGTLDTQDGKAMQVPNAPDGYRFIDQLVNDYHYYQKCNPYLAATWVYNESKRLANLGKVVVYENIRNPQEAQLLTRLATEGYDMAVIVVSSYREKNLTSDQHLLANYTRLSQVANLRTAVDNSGTLKDLEAWLEPLARRLLGC